MWLTDRTTARDADGTKNYWQGFLQPAAPPTPTYRQYGAPSFFPITDFSHKRVETRDLFFSSIHEKIHDILTERKKLLFIWNIFSGLSTKQYVTKILVQNSKCVNINVSIRFLFFLLDIPKGRIHLIVLCQLNIEKLYSPLSVKGRV